MRIAVISDTHLPRFGRALPRPLLRGFDAAAIERILHLGDWTTDLAVGLVEALGRPLDGVAGNNDPPELVERFGRVKVVEVGGLRIGLTHGDLGPGRTTPERAARTFEHEAVDAILFGHSHAPLLTWRPSPTLAAGRQLLLNPGSPTDKRAQPRYSWTLLMIESGSMKAELRSFDRSG